MGSAIVFLIAVAVMADLMDCETHALVFSAMAVFLAGANGIARAIERKR